MLLPPGLPAVVVVLKARTLQFIVSIICEVPFDSLPRLIRKAEAGKVDFRSNRCSAQRLSHDLEMFEVPNAPDTNPQVKSAKHSFAQR